MTPLLAPEPLVFVDLETTGANFAKDRIIEIGLVEVDQDGVREWSSLVDPGTPVSAFITGLTGIDTAMVSSAPSFAQLAPTVLEKLRGRLFIAHNARFDYGFLKGEFKRLGIDFRAAQLCTVRLSRKLFPEHHRHNLDSLLERHDIVVADRHRALVDARVLWRLWQRWHELLPNESVRGAIKSIVGRAELPPHLDPLLFDELPEAPGAYALYAADGNLLLSKRSTNIRRQLFAQFAAGKHDTPLVRATVRVDWREAAGELGARLRELELSASVRKSADDLCAWQLTLPADADFAPHLVLARDVDFTRAGDLYGLYGSRREALHALRKIADAHRLCLNQLGIGAGKPGEACIGYKQRICRGVCAGKEAPALHNARLMSALAKFKLSDWPYSGPVALIEGDPFGMHEDYHLVDRWQHLGTVHDEAALVDILDARRERDSDSDCNGGVNFDPDVYRIISKFIRAGKTRVLALPVLPQRC